MATFLGSRNVLLLSWSEVTIMKHFFHMAMIKPKKNKLYSTSKRLLPNIFSGTCFKKHQGFLVEQQKHPPFFLLTLHYRSLSRHKSVQGKLFFASYWLSLHMKILDYSKTGRFHARRFRIEKSWICTKIFQGGGRILSFKYC